MELQAIVDILNTMLDSKEENVQCRCRGITNVDIYYDDDIIITLRKKKEKQNIDEKE